jgi:hypothetical protein
MDFTGVHDAHDDQVDALAAAFDDLTRFPPSRSKRKKRRLEKSAGAAFT